MWDDRWITEPVRVTPSGKKSRPYFFEKSVAVSLEVPFVKGAEIHYTLDGSEPTEHAAKYERPVALKKTAGCAPRRSAAAKRFLWKTTAISSACLRCLRCRTSRSIG